MTNISVILDTGTEIVIENPVEESIQLAYNWGEHIDETIVFESDTDYLSLLTCKVSAVMVYEEEEEDGTR